LSYAPTVGILAGRTNENYNIRRRFLAGEQQRSSLLHLVCTLERTDARVCGTLQGRTPPR